MNEGFINELDALLDKYFEDLWERSSEVKRKNPSSPWSSGFTLNIVVYGNKGDGAEPYDGTVDEDELEERKY